MNTREQFGNYLLLKKLTEDPLGETFRAGQLSSKGMERVTLLRIFNGQGLDGPRLWESTQPRREIVSQLRNPNIGEGIEMGEIQGIPYVAYEYISGKNMAKLLEQAAKKRQFVPTEHALLITERVALALAAASETRIGGERIRHGFLVPQLTMISNEGETRLTGFEVAPALRGFCANPVIRQHFGRYLAPEALAGAGPDKSDDIYSLGVFLFELLTGRPLPPPAADGYTSVIDQAMLATEEKPMPDALRALLKSSLVGREQRINDVVAWHKSLNAWMFEGQYNPTTFNLAFYMHNLFRQEIERENQEIEVEKTLPVPTVTPASGPMVAATPASGPLPEPAAPMPAAPESSAVMSAPVPTATAEPTQEHTRTDVIPEYARQDKKSNTGLFLALAAVVIAAVVGGVWYFMGDSAEPPPVVAATPPPPPPPPQGPTPEEIKARIDELIAQKTEGMEEQLRTQYEDQLAELQNQLDDSKKQAERRRQLEAERRQKEQEAELARQAEEEEAAREAARLVEQQKAEEEAAAARKKQEDEAAAARIAEAAPPPPAVTPPPPPSKPQVRRGDLVELGPGVKPPKRLRLNPRFPEMARRLRRPGADVSVQALIDENGEVLEVKLVNKKVGYGFDTEALQAVKKALFEPASTNGVPVKVWYTVNVKFEQ